jgi:hypothetical protein
MDRSFLKWLVVMRGTTGCVPSTEGEELTVKQPTTISPSVTNPSIVKCRSGKADICAAVLVYASKGLERNPSLLGSSKVL